MRLRVLKQIHDFLKWKIGVEGSEPLNESLQRMHVNYGGIQMHLLFQPSCIKEEEDEEEAKQKRSK
jgi:hypothetical protein